MANSWSWISAFLLSYWASRGMARLPLPFAPVPRLFAIHALAGLALFLVVGLAKAYFTPFAAQQARIVLLTQAIWLALDLFVTGARHVAGKSGDRAR